jgi:JAB domain-containing protein similar to deubiquitination enzymes
VKDPWLLLPEAVRDATLSLLQSSGTRRVPHEGVVYWLGVETSGPFAVLQALAPRATTGSGFFRTTSGANAEAIGVACELGLAIVAQVHSHPRGWAEHSDGDDERALKPYPGSLSVVIPQYARGAVNPAAWGVYRWNGTEFESPQDLGSPITIVPTARDLR